MQAESKHFPDAFYRVTIKGLCVRDGKVLLIRESEEYGGKDHWELPGGGLDFGEDIYTGFNRETEEEMGLKISKISRRPMYLWTHRFENRRNIDWFYSLIVAYRIEFEHLNFTPTPECEEIKFFSKEELLELAPRGQLTNLPAIFNPEDFRTDF